MSWLVLLAFLGMMSFWGAGAGAGAVDNPVVPAGVVDISTQRVGFSAVVAGEFVYVLGGFYHADQGGGDPVQAVDVYSVNGTKLNSTLPPLPTPRGFMTTILLNNSLIVTIGGVESLLSETGTTNVEALQLDPLTPLNGTWDPSWSKLFVPRVNATASILNGGIVVALGAQQTPYPELVEWIAEGDHTVQPSLPTACDSGILGTASSDALALFCYGNSTASFLLTDNSAWQRLSVTPLSSWSIQSIQPVTSDASFFMASTVEHSSFLFYLSEGNMTQYVCFTGLQCSGTFLVTNSSWVCLTTHVVDEQRSRADLRSTDTIKDWPMYHGNTKRTGQGSGFWTCYPAFATQLAVKWSFPTPYGMAFSPVLDAEGTLYFAVQNDTAYKWVERCSTIFAVNGDSGEVKWSTTYNMTDDTALVMDGHLYIAWGGMISGPLIAKFNTTDGSLVAQSNYNSVATSSAINVDPSGNLWLGTFEAFMVGFNSTTLDLVFSQEYGVIQSSPAIDENGVIYQGFSSNTVFVAFNQSQVLDDEPTGPALGAGAAIGPDGTIYTGSVDTYLRAWRWANGTLHIQWEQLVAGMILSTPAVGLNNWVYVVSGYGLVYAFDGDTGVLQWSIHITPTPREYISSPALAGDLTVFVGLQESMVALDGWTGIVKWNYTVAEAVRSSPALGPDGTVYVCSGLWGTPDGNVYAFNGGLAENHWATAPLLME